MVSWLAGACVRPDATRVTLFAVLLADRLTVRPVSGQFVASVAFATIRRYANAVRAVAIAHRLAYVLLLIRRVRESLLALARIWHHAVCVHARDQADWHAGCALHCPAVAARFLGHPVVLKVRCDEICNKFTIIFEN